MTNQLLFSIKKGDLVRTSEHLGYIIKYSSNKEITIQGEEIAVISKDQIIAVNEVSVKQMHKEKVTATINKVVESQLGSEFVGYKLKLGSKGWILIKDETELHSCKTALEMAKYLKANDLKNLPCVSKLPSDVRNLIFKNMSTYDKYKVEA